MSCGAFAGPFGKEDSDLVVDASVTSGSSSVSWGVMALGIDSKIFDGVSFPILMESSIGIKSDLPNTMAWSKLKSLDNNAARIAC